MELILSNDEEILLGEMTESGKLSLRILYQTASEAWLEKEVLLDEEGIQVLTDLLESNKED